jgi:molybdate transport system substrate-binding protein
VSKPRLALVAALGLGLAHPLGVGRASDQLEPLRVAAAADLKFALDEVVVRYRQVRPGVEVSPAYGSSGLLFAQLSNGAPFDLFLSASAAYPRRLVAEGVALQGSEFPYAVGRIVLWVRRESPLPVETSGLQALLAGTVQRIAIANPVHAPYGQAAEAALKRYGLHDRLKAKLVFGENASQTTQFAQTGSVDAAIIPLSIASAPTLAGEGRYWIIPLDAHPRLEQVGVRIKSSRRPEEARRLAEFLAGPEGRAILRRYGFILPGE